MKKIALVTPWPPQASGIADYAYELASHLSGSNVEVHVFTNEPSPELLKGVFFHHVYSGYAACTELTEFDSILLQIGNHPHYHGYMLQILERLKHKCTVELHDLMLHHLMQGDMGLSAGGEKYFSWLKSNYGELVGNIFQDFLLNGGDILNFPPVLEFPCADILIKNSNKIVVHSEFVKSRLVRDGCRRIWKVDLTSGADFTYREITKSKSNRCFRIGIFGGVQRNRRIDWVIEALSALMEKNIPIWQLDIVGTVDRDCENLVAMTQRLGMTERVKFHGRLPLSELNEIISTTDLHIALRSPTMGETSAVVTRAMRFGIPSIVSNVGWYSELPPYVLKVDDSDANNQLTCHIYKLLNDSKALDEIRIKTMAFAERRINMRIAADDILNVIFEQ
jgi:glycosyltransferase involved in cell wall biosynthesis